MNYDEFKDVVEKEFMSYMPEEYQHMKMEIRQVKKVNAIKDGISFNDSNKEGYISPTIYVDDLYESYVETGDWREVFTDAAESVAKALNDPLVKEGLNFEDAKENIVIQLINTEQNREMLNDLPHREFEDLSIIYRWVVGVDKGGIQSAVVNKSFMERLGLDEEQMYELAVENYKRILLPTVRKMDDFIKETYMRGNMPEEIVESIFSGRPANEMMWIISNAAGFNGAATILYDEILQEIAKEVDSNLYILPSSTHETIAVSVNGGDPYMLAQIVNEINMKEVILEERLSNQVYHYDRDLHKLTMATDTPHKRLDGRVEEPLSVYGTHDRSR